MAGVQGLPTQPRQISAMQLRQTSTCSIIFRRFGMSVMCWQWAQVDVSTTVTWSQRKYSPTPPGRSAGMLPLDETDVADGRRCEVARERANADAGQVGRRDDEVVAVVQGAPTIGTALVDCPVLQRQAVTGSCVGELGRGVVRKDRKRGAIGRVVLVEYDG